jgi:hypothetical protein
MFQNVKKRASRRGWPIHGYVGANGGGKSAAMVWDTLPSLEAGRSVLSTVRLLDYLDPRPCDDLACDCDKSAEDRHGAAHPLWIPFRDWTQLLDAEHVDVLMDEVTGVASSRESHSMPSVVANTLVQMRRRDVVIRWSAPNWRRADVIIRECSQAVSYAVGYLPTVAEDSDGQRAWRNRRLFKWRTYDAADFEDFTSGKREQLRPMTVDWHWGPGSPVFKAYDTFDAVLTIGTVSDAGVCLACMGSRRRQECSCPDYVARKRSRGKAEGGSPEGGPEASPLAGGGRRVLQSVGHA